MGAIRGVLARVRRGLAPEDEEHHPERVEAGQERAHDARAVDRVLDALPGAARAAARLLRASRTAAEYFPGLLHGMWNEIPAPTSLTAWPMSL
jgi:hypothetical protein